MHECPVPKGKKVGPQKKLNDYRDKLRRICTRSRPKG